MSIDLDSWDANKPPNSSENGVNKPQSNNCKSSPVAKKKPRLIPSTNRKNRANTSVKKEYNQGAAWQRLDIITAQSVFQLPKIDKENFSTFRPEGLRQES